MADWLAEHGDRSEGVWLVTWKRATGRPSPSYDEVVTEAKRPATRDKRVAEIAEGASRSERTYFPPARGVRKA